MTTEGFCPACGASRAVDAAFCGKCGHAFVATETQPAFAMRNVGMLPSTRYKLLGLWIVLLVGGWAVIFSSMDFVAAYFSAFIWFLAVTIPWAIVFFIWGSVRQAQVNLEYERWLKGQRR